MKTKVFIYGSEGTTGLRIHERFMNRDDIELLNISKELRKDRDERKRLINQSDITFLCLPDDAARESVSLIENDHVRIIDPSTAHRTVDGWSYGFPELSKEHKDKIINGKRVAVPGCHATGFISLVYPLIKEGILSADYPVSCFSITGFSGGGNGMIASYRGQERPEDLLAPRQYALTQGHKHLKEMKAITGLSREPLFSPVVSDYYNGMLVSLPFYMDMMKNVSSVVQLQEFYKEYYKDQAFIKVLTPDHQDVQSGFLSSNTCAGWDGMELIIAGNQDRVVLYSRFDNLGKGASGAAIQCLNLMIGCDEAKGLEL